MIDGTPPTTGWGDGWAFLEQAVELRRQGQSFAMATVVWRQGPSSSQQGSRAIITAAGEIHGWIGGACAEPVVIREAGKVIAEGEPRLLLLGTTEQFGTAIPEGIAVVPISCQSEGAVEVYIEPVLPTPQLVVVGRSPMAQTLVELGRALGWESVLHDVSDFRTAEVGEQSMVVVATQGHGDEEAVEQAVAANPAYLGLVGSARRGEAVIGYLTDRGLAEEALERIRVPAGLDLGATSHREIAVAVLAQLVALRASGELTTGAGTAATARTQLVEEVDPVCGMTVRADVSSHPVDYDGTTYYFCRVGCRTEFEKDPSAYVQEERRHADQQ